MKNIWLAGVAALFVAGCAGPSVTELGSGKSDITIDECVQTLEARVVGKQKIRTNLSSEIARYDGANDNNCMLERINKRSYFVGGEKILDFERHTLNNNCTYADDEFLARSKGRVNQLDRHTTAGDYFLLEGAKILNRDRSQTVDIAVIAHQEYIGEYNVHRFYTATKSGAESYQELKQCLTGKYPERKNIFYFLGSAVEKL